ncbi:DUF342 domain-containing protein [Pelotalea chapellei]|uniref:DUF342 domain-containing protein n=1 Tax=Pelotalea chapellei TaxID=44671 RepID=A0ABS5U7Y8_9BACT|nr:FapA family protein [Pelotalea chapellei]MBT1071781.1 DUF342 domain-containing protein [Pelotalea chapellei]
MDTVIAQTTVSGVCDASPAGKEYKKLGYSFYVWISEDNLECRCSYVPREQGSMMTRDDLMNYLALSSVREGILQEVIDAFAVMAAAGKTLSMVTVAVGTPPIAGQDGWLSYKVSPSIVVVHDIDETADIDFHNVQSFMNITPGEEIGTIISPEPGTAGKNVLGQVIPPQPGKPLNLKIGQYIRVCGENGNVLLAEAAGRICMISGEISIAEEYIVSGDVDFRVGSIIFNGFVEVRGDILDGFNVYAAKGLRVNGNIGACIIKSDGDVSLCGMDGQEKGTITCGGSIKANFLHDCAVECAGDVMADFEIHNCHIQSLGRIIVNKGAIAGGSCTALGGIETKKAGSASSIKTILRAGIDYRTLAEFSCLLKDLEKNSEQTKQAGSFQDMEILRKERAQLSDRLMALKKYTDERSNPKVNVKAMMYDNTYLCLSLEGKQKLDERKGPFTAIEDTIEGGLRFLSMTCLDVKAVDIERAFVKEYNFRRKVILPQ